MAGGGALSTLDVVIGLVFVFFLMSVVCSALNEALSAIFGWRAKTLEEAIRGLVGDPELQGQAKDLATEVLDHWRIAQLSDPRAKSAKRRKPSYIPPRAFSLAVTQTLATKAQPPGGEDDGGPTPWQQDDAKVLTRVQRGIDELPPGQARIGLQTAAHHASDEVEQFRRNLEAGFDDTMERASGWYKRKVQLVIAVIAAVVAIGFNVDAVHVGTRLWNDQVTRTAVADQAVRQSSTAQGAADAAEHVQQLQLPVGWGAGNAPTGLVSWLSHVPGWIITITALSAGAPFWFDVLSRLARLRATGLPAQPRSLSDNTGTGAR
jgi:hypothetical protein